MLRRLALLALPTMALHAHAAPAAWLHACPAASGQGRHVVNAVAHLPGCAGVALPIAAPADVETVHPLDPHETPDATVLLHGTVEGGRFVIGEYELPSPRTAPPPAPLPLHANLLPAMHVRAFGIEERVTATLADGRLRIDCRAGRRPAGAILSAPAYLPRARLDLAVRYTAGAAFAWQAADAAGAERGQALDLGTANAAAQPLTARFALPPGLDRGTWRRFVVSCPLDAAVFEAASLALEPRGTPVAAPRATWVWRAAEWIEDGARLLDRAAAHGIADLFITVPLDGGAAVHAPQRLARFVRAAGRRGMRVYSVDGDPRMVLASELPAAVRRARAYAAYNAAAAPRDRLAGMQFDVEPYLLPTGALAAAERDAGYLALARALWDVAAASGSLRLEFVVPFWWAGKRDLLDALAAYADALAVMDYRTDPAQVTAFAMPFLDWADVHGRRTRIALEAGPIAPAIQRRYVRAQAGEAADLLAADVDGQTVLLLLRRPQALADLAGVRAYRLAASRDIDGSATTFHADRPALLRLLPRLEADFGAWDGFGGIAVHELR